MPKGYHHLTYDKRCQIQTLKERGDSINKIAEALKVHRSSIYREIARNSKNDRKRTQRKPSALAVGIAAPNTAIPAEKKFSMEKNNFSIIFS